VEAASASVYLGKGNFRGFKHSSSQFFLGKRSGYMFLLSTFLVILSKFANFQNTPVLRAVYAEIQDLVLHVLALENIE